jgi:NAD(P)-dependent dehydrogenase (short-subunit alcohol dehydrogenase family)
VSKPLSECAVAITGGTSGVGLASAHQFAEAGVTRLALLGRNPARGAAAVETLLAAHPKVAVHFLAVDANDPAQATRATTSAHDLLDGLDVLVNSTAATYMPDLLKNTPIETMGTALMQQALAPMHMSRAALPFLVAQQSGVILNIASDAAKVPTPGEAVVGAAMAAIVMFSKTLAVEAKRDGIRVNTITPSLIQGTITGELALSGGFSRKLFEKALQMAHLGATEVDDLAALVVFLAGPGAAKITGQVISVNGGISVA